MREFIATVADCEIARLLVILILMDVAFGVLRSIKYGKLNSSIGINGIIRKSCMFITVICMNMVDVIFHLDVVEYVPDEIVSFLGLSSIGVAEGFALIFILCEGISVLKNMLLCGVPLPKGLIKRLYNILDKWTDEVNDFNLLEDETGRCKVIRKTDM